jgi:hypothetical protein
MTGVGASYLFYVDLLSALGVALLTLFVTLMSTSIKSFSKAIMNSVLSAPLPEREFREARSIFAAIEHNLIIAILLVLTIDFIGILAGNANATNVNWLRIVSAGLLDLMYGLIYLLLIQGFKNRLRELQ